LPRNRRATALDQRGFFVLERRAIDYVSGDDTVWRREPLESLARDGQLAAFRHTGFWHPVDTLARQDAP